MNVPQLARANQVSLTKLVERAVRDGIRSRELIPGEIYSVQQIADLIGVSRSPAREALLKLADAGLAVIERNRGFRVVLPRPRDIAEIFAVRLALEPAAAERLARRADSAETAGLRDRMTAMGANADVRHEDTFWSIDREIHGFILREAGNFRAAAIVESLREITALLGEPTSAVSRTLTDIEAEHRTIVDTILERDPLGARTAMEAHLTSTGRLLMAQTAGLRPDAPAIAMLWSEVLSGAAR